ncbi:MAG TPA: hypothetical protein VGE13_01730 [Candidatus Saccharimonadales bacterium]
MENTKHIKPEESVEPSGNWTKSIPVKKYIMYVLIGGLVLSALISIVAVLAGEFNDTVGRAFGTTLTIMLHSLLGLLFLSVKRSRSLSGAILINTTFTLIVASMMTSILGIWDIVPGRIVGDLYSTYLLTVVAALIISGLVSAHIKDKVVGGLAWGASGTVVVAFISLIPWIFAEFPASLPQFYFRVVAALFILAATVTILTVIFDRLFMIKHPELKAPTNPNAMPLWVKILLGFLIFIFGGWWIIVLLFGLVGSMFS